MLSTIAALFSICNGAFTFIKNLLGIKSAGSEEGAATEAVKVTNEASRASAQVSRDTEHSLQTELSHVDQDTADDLSRLHDAGSLRDEVATLNDAIARANQDARADGGVQ